MLKPDKVSETERELRAQFMAIVLRNRFIDEGTAPQIIVEVEQLVQYVIHGREKPS